MHGHTDCMKAEEIRSATIHDEHLSMLLEYVLHGWRSTRDEVEKELQQCWTFRDESVITDGITMKGKRIII